MRPNINPILQCCSFEHIIKTFKLFVINFLPDANQNKLNSVPFTLINLVTKINTVVNALFFILYNAIGDNHGHIEVSLKRVSLRNISQRR